MVSDVFYIIVRYLLKYRYSVVMENLSYAFPENTLRENKKIANRFYSHFADLMVETIKLHNISDNEINNRVQAEGLELLNELYQQGTSVIVLAMHHNNWEWCSYLLSGLQHKSLLIYNPLRGNQALENFLLQSRERWGGRCIPVNQSARTALQFHRDQIPTLIWLGADQTPPANSQFWSIFLNREAPFFSGPEKIAQKTNQPVFFQHMSKIKRGHYVTRFIPLLTNPSEMESKDILLAYIRKMEEIIKKEPEYYLWSHRRWKHSRPENIPLSLP